MLFPRRKRSDFDRGTRDGCCLEPALSLPQTCNFLLSQCSCVRFFMLNALGIGSSGWSSTARQRWASRVQQRPWPSCRYCRYIHCKSCWHHAEFLGTGARSVEPKPSSAGEPHVVSLCLSRTSFSRSPLSVIALHEVFMHFSTSRVGDISHNPPMGSTGQGRVKERDANISC